jgi:hypothetical protein
LCENKRLKQPPKLPWLPQLLSQPLLSQQLSQLEQPLLQPPQLPLLPNQNALAVQGTLSTATIKAMR